MKKSSCTKHPIRIDKMYNAVLETIQKQIDIAVDFDEILKIINTNPKKKTESEIVKKSMQKAEEQLRFKKSEKLELYDDLKSGILTKEEYFEQKERISLEIENAEKTLESLTAAASNLQNGVDGTNEFITAFKKYGNITELTRPMLVELVKKIKVYENNTIEIEFNFADPFAEAIEYISMNKPDLEAAS